MSNETQTNQPVEINEKGKAFIQKLNEFLLNSKDEYGHTIEAQIVYAPQGLAARIVAVELVPEPVETAPENAPAEITNTTE